MTGSALQQINLGIVGAVGRGGSFRRSVEAIPELRLHALCDINAEGLAKAAGELAVGNTFTDYLRMLDSGQVDAVIVGTPMPLHVPQAIEALRRNIHVISEVPAAVNVEECRRLVEAAKASKAIYMMAENYTYSKPNQVVKELVRRGLFGEVYYAEGEYLHELKGLGERTTWRRHWQNGIDGITYGTHSLGPILQWYEGQRVTRVCCAGSGRHHTDPRGEPYAQDTSVMLCQMSGGGLAKIRVDMISDRPHAMTNYQLQGKDGCYESARAKGEINRIWLRAKSETLAWTDLASIWDDYTPESWIRLADLAAKAGHGGGDLLELVDFVDAVTGKRPCPIGIHEAMDMTLPGLISQHSIQQRGAWLDVPDSRVW